MKSKIILNRIFINIFFLIFILSACKGSDGNMGPTGPKGDDGAPGPKLIGTLSGYIFLWDVNGKKLQPSSSATVMVEETDRIANCDSTGRWKLDSLETGIYNLDFKLDGFGTYVKKTFQFIGGGDVFYGNVTLWQIPEFYVDSISTSFDYGLNQVVISGTISNPHSAGGNYYLYFFAGTDSDVSSNPEHYIYVNQDNTPSTEFSVRFSKPDLINAGFKKGSNVFFRAYGCSYLTYYGGIEGGKYIDPDTGRMVYICLSAIASPVANIVLP